MIDIYVTSPNLPNRIHAIKAYTSRYVRIATYRPSVNPTDPYTTVNYQPLPATYPQG